MYVYLSLLYVRMVQPNATIKNTCYCRVSTSLDTQISCICVYPPVHTYVVSVHVQVTLPFNVPQPHWATPPSFIDCQLHFRGWPRWGCVCGMGCIVWLLCDLWCCWLWLVWSDTITKFWTSCNIQQLVWCKNINEARCTWLQHSAVMASALPSVRDTVSVAPFTCRHSEQWWAVFVWVWSSGVVMLSSSCQL